MREPFVLLLALVFAIAAGVVATWWPNVWGFSLALGFACAGFWIAISRDASFEQEIDDLLHEHARQSRGPGETA